MLTTSLLILFVIVCSFLIHYYSSQVIKNLINVLTVLQNITKQLETINIILINKAEEK